MNAALRRAAGLVLAAAASGAAGCADARPPADDPAGPPAAGAFLPTLDGYHTDDDVDAGEIRASLDHGAVPYAEVRRRLVLGDDGFARGQVVVVTFEADAGGPDQFLDHWFGDAPRTPVAVGGQTMLRIPSQAHDALAWTGPGFVVVFGRGQAVGHDWLEGLARATARAAGHAAAGADDPERIRAELFELERESHQQWLRGDVAALDALMADGFRFVAMNGAIETKEFVIGTDRDSAAHRERPLRITSLEVEPESLVLHGNTAVVLATLHMDATVAGRPLPPTMTILSIFMRDGPDAAWRLAARSITPILAPPGPAAGGAARP